MDPRALPLPELLRSCLQAENEACWLEFVRRCQPLMAAVIIKTLRRWTTPSPALIDDLIQETYLKLCANNFRALREFDSRHEAALFGFLKVVVSNVVQDHMRSSHSQKRGSGKEAEELEQVEAIAISAVSAGSKDLDRNILIGEIRHCLETHAAEPTYTRDCRIFWLYYQQGLTAKAISELPAIDLTVKGVESTLLRLTRLVREKMNERPGRERGQAEASGS